MSKIIDKAVQVTANSINKTLYQAIVDGDLGAGGGGGSSPVEIFNHTIQTRGGSTTLTGLNYFLAPSNLLITDVKILVWDKLGISSGILSFDLKKSSTPDDVGMTSIFTTQPSINFATDPNYTSSTGVLLSGSIASGQFIRLDITSIPLNWSGEFTVMVYA